MTESIRERKERKIGCTPMLLLSSPQKSPLGELISLALLDCLLVQCALCISCPQLVKEENKYNERG